MIFYEHKEWEPDLSDVFIPDSLDQEQLASADLMVRGHHWLLSDPGAGKTLTAIDAYAGVCHEERAVAFMVVVCPIIALGMWAKTLEKVLNHTPLIEDQLVGEEATIQIVRKNDTIINPYVDIIVVPFSVASNKKSKFREFMKRSLADCMVIDETDCLTNPEAAITKSILLDRDALVHSAKKVWPMSGTPWPRYANGAWPILRALFHEKLMSRKVLNYDSFVRRYCITREVTYSGMWKPKRVVSRSQRHEELRSMLFDGAIPVASRNKLVLEDYCEKVHELTHFKPSAELRDMLENLDKVEYDDEGFPIVNSGAQAAALQQLAIEGLPAVMPVVTQLLREAKKLGDNRAMLCLFWHKEVGKQALAAAKEAGLRAALIDGSTADRKREDIVEQFDRGDLDLMFGQIKAMGVALNLQMNCNYVACVEETWSAAWDLQAIQRVWRRGQLYKVSVNRFDLCVKLDKLKPRAQSSKRSDAALILDGEKL